MAGKNNTNIGFEKQIWDAACVLWGHIPAAEYRKVIVGLIFLRYISSAFERRYDELVKEGDGFENDRDAYAEENIFFVPEEARWSKIASEAHTPEIGTVIDDAMRAIEKENTTLKNVLPKNYANPDLDKRVLGEVVDLFTNEVKMDGTEAGKDLLGRTYEYCIAQFAAYEGTKGGEFYTPSSIVKTIVAILKPFDTGFDVPSLATMYVYKPMAGHNLMQAIARVNRVFRDKEGGLVVDYVGIATALKQAMNDYTSRDKKNYGDTDVAKVAYPKFMEKLTVCRDKFHGYDYSKFKNGTDLERAKTISGAVNFIIGREKVDDKDSFVKEALMLHQALSLCSSLVDEESRFEAAFFEAVRVLVLRLTVTGVGKKISLPEMNARINELLKQSIKSDGVINLFSDIKEEFSLFDPKFLQEVANMKEKNLAVELLKKLIAEQVSVYRRTNVVKSEKFSDIMQRAINSYLNGMLTNEEVIEEMLKLAKQIAADQKEGNKLGLNADELAFYDALTKPQAIKDFYENEELIAITKELTETLRKNKTIDWQKRESARAKMRMLIKKLLKKHKYPPEGMEDAVQTVMTQCELWTDNYSFGENNNIYRYANNMENALPRVAEEKTKYNI